MVPAPTITPLLRYRDPKIAAHWLGLAFGLEQGQIVTDAGGQVRYISLRLGNGSVLACPSRGWALDHLMVQPDDTRGLSTQACYMTVSDVDAHSARAQAAGAKIEIAPQDDGTGGRFYSCRDCDGHLWSFGTRDYGPADAQDAPAPEPPAPKPRSLPGGASLSALAVMVALGWVLYDANQRATLTSVVRAPATQAQAGHSEMRGGLQGDGALRADLERSVDETGARLEAERAAGAELRNELRRMLAKATELERAKAAAETALGASQAAAARQLQAIEQARARQAETEARLVRAERDLQASAGVLREARIAEETAQRSRAEATAAFAAEREQRAAAQEERDELRARVAQLEEGIIAERQLRIRADQELAAVGAQLAELKQPAAAREADPRHETAALSEARPGSPTESRPEAVSEPKPGMQDDEANAAPAGSDNNRRQSARRPAGVCRATAWASGRPRGWTAANLVRLCKGAYNSPEPAKCFHQLMRGKVNWGGGSSWTVDNALTLCGGTLSASHTVDCFVKNIAAGVRWRTAIRRCKTG